MKTSESTLLPDQLRRQIQGHLQSQQWQAAEEGFRKLIELKPDEPHARIGLANLILQRGGLREYTQQLLDAMPVLTNEASLLIEMVRRLFFGGEIVAARQCLDRIGSLSTESAPLLAEQAQLRWMLGEIPGAMVLMERAMAVGVDGPNQHYLYAMLLQFTGKIEQAGAVLAGCLRRWPRFGDAAVALANLRAQKPEANHVDTLRLLSNGIPIDSQSADRRLARAGFESALFKELDDLGHYDEAWQALCRSNALMRSISPYDESGEAAVTDALIRISEVIEGKQGAPMGGVAGPTPIFIVGMPRSGTTLLDRMLSSHSQVTSAGEINDFRRQLRWVTDVPPGGIPSMLEVFRRSEHIDFAELGQRYLAQTQWRAQGKRFYLDKLPINVRMVPFIRRALPQAPILHLVRDPMDVCFSNLKAMLGHVSAYSYDMSSLAHYYGEYARLARHWHELMPDAMLDVSYAELVLDTESTLRKVLAYCELPWERECLLPEQNEAPVATPSSSQVREPIHARSLGEWQRYAAQLEPLRRMIA
ncbi:sulfotransferase [Dyella sp.]|uniref:sulfotransferase n=1 Tax=Dyella sp. TaxID=1869338 RepID=UPI002B48C591|nr:sulfotransferase [Dyella sp.]HKT30067.1 sulfotransferase [Dyella sp.]